MFACLSKELVWKCYKGLAFSAWAPAESPVAPTVLDPWQLWSNIKWLTEWMILRRKQLLLWWLLQYPEQLILRLKENPLNLTHLLSSQISYETPNRYWVKRRTGPRPCPHITLRILLYTCAPACFTGEVFFKRRGLSYSTRLCILAPTIDADCFVDMYYMKEHRNNSCGLWFLQNVHGRIRGTQSYDLILPSVWWHLGKHLSHLLPCGQEQQKHRPSRWWVIPVADDVKLKGDREKAEQLCCHSSFIANWKGWERHAQEQLKKKSNSRTRNCRGGKGESLDLWVPRGYGSFL